jgi:large subunit ribosomal protein L3
MLRDAVKKALPKDAPKPGKFRATEGAAAPEAGAAPAAEQAQEGA